MKLILTVLILLNILLAADNNTYVATYNIKWLGYSKYRENTEIANLLSQTRDLVLIQEIVAPPYDLIMDNGKKIKGDAEVAAFFEAMHNVGYTSVMSSEDTGTGEKNHKNSAATEWFVAFYKENKLNLVNNGFLAEDRSNHDDYERVPYYFTFSNEDGMDFTIISTHLMPGAGKKKRVRRYHELSSIFNWIEEMQLIDTERDYIVLGDMNVYKCKLLDENLFNGFVRANEKCLNSNLKMNKPYDQVLYNPAFTSITGYEVIDMFEIYNIPRTTPNKKVIAKYSDHHPVYFTIQNEQDDD